MERKKISARSWIVVNAENIAKLILQYRNKGGFLMKRSLYEDVTDKENLCILLNKVPVIEQAIEEKRGIIIYC